MKKKSIVEKNIIKDAVLCYIVQFILCSKVIMSCTVIRCNLRPLCLSDSLLVDS